MRDLDRLRVRRHRLSFVVNILLHIIRMLLFSRDFGELKFREPSLQTFCHHA